jgi:hypothetical protein
MIAKMSADLLVLLHLLFILFVLCGGLLLLKWRWIPWLHLPCLLWGILIEFYGWICPLTPWENHFRAVAGATGYEGGFIDHYLIPLIYPSGLDRRLQIGLGIAVVLLNLIVYVWVLLRPTTRRKP